jgi:hypothetical protein
MSSIDIKTALDWLGAITISVGGTSVIVIALSKWFGDRLANKLLEKDKAKYQKVLEELKTKFQEELEIKKIELEKTKALFLRYSEYQFNLYNDLWKSLCDLKNIGEELWEKAETKKVKDFSTQLRTTKLTVEKSALLIEDDHYKELIRILDNFGKFEIGKLTLISLRNRQTQELASYGVNEHEIRITIDENRLLKEEFNIMVDQLSVSFKRQIKGE